MKKVKQLCCKECGKDNIEWMVWADELDVVTGIADENGETWCADCKEHTDSIFKKDYFEEIIGNLIEHPADKDDRLYHEEQAHKAMEKVNDR